eukprot:Sdes_comp15827_c0_seq1m4905
MKTSAIPSIGELWPSTPVPTVALSPLKVALSTWKNISSNKISLFPRRRAEKILPKNFQILLQLHILDTITAPTGLFSVSGIVCLPQPTNHLYVCTICVPLFMVVSSRIVNFDHHGLAQLSSDKTFTILYP